MGSRANPSLLPSVLRLNNKLCKGPKKQAKSKPVKTRLGSGGNVVKFRRKRAAL